VKGCRGAQGQPPALITLRCHNRGGRAVGASHNAVRGLVDQVYTPHLLPAHHASYNSMRYGSHIPNKPHDFRGACKAQGLEAKPARWVRAAHSKQSEGQSDTWGGQQLALSGAPLRGHDTLKLCICVLTGRFPSCPFMWAGT
jgi:hypothetical protein